MLHILKKIDCWLCYGSGHLYCRDPYCEYRKTQKISNLCDNLNCPQCLGRGYLFIDTGITTKMHTYIAPEPVGQFRYIVHPGYGTYKKREDL